MKIIGIDTGGTFTDFVLFEPHQLRIHKVLSTPHAPELAILQGIEELGLDPEGLLVIHGSTVATNAVLERKGVKTLYIANRGLADILTIGRQARRELYNLQPAPIEPPVPAAYCIEVDARIDAQGQVITELNPADLQRVTDKIKELSPDAVAVNLLFSYLDPSFEQAIREVIPKGIFCSLSSDVLPQIREYERGIATWLNAWVGPLVRDYLQRLEAKLPGATLSVMQSSGETIAASQAGDQAVRMLLSGPAGGLVGAGFTGKLAAREKLLTFDMGGTSTDVALIDGEPKLTHEGRIGHWPVGVPMVDMHTIGAGGGSIARVDSGGMLLVGPASAGADPGPACYGQGGTLATVTDANLLLGRLRADAFLGGRMKLDAAAATRVIEPLAQQLKCTIEEAALGIIQLADEHMSQALRVISVQRGIDPRDYTLVSFGGAGGLHVCALANALKLRQAMVPIHCGVLSALGMVAARPGRRYSRTLIKLLAEMSQQRLDEEFHQMTRTGVTELKREGVKESTLQMDYSLDLRYLGQSYTLNIPWLGIQSSIQHFEAAHLQRYGHAMKIPVELVHLNVGLKGSRHAFFLSEKGAPDDADIATRIDVYGLNNPVPLYHRDKLACGQILQGPAIIIEDISTTWLETGWEAIPDRFGNLMLHHL